MWDESFAECGRLKKVGNFLEHRTAESCRNGRGIMKILSIIIATALLVTSCATAPTPPAEQIKFLTRSRVERMIHKGVTTKAQVLAEFGPPSAEVVMNSDLPGAPYETISYSKRYTLEVAVLTVSLNRKGIVTGYTFTGTGPMVNDTL